MLPRPMRAAMPGSSGPGSKSSSPGMRRRRARRRIRLLIGYDGREVSELSTGEQMPVRTLELLWQFLTGRLENPEMRCDLFIDLFFQFKRLEGLELQPLTPQRVRIRSDRWPTGLDPEVAEVRARNRERMLHLLVQKIENRKSTPSRFRFEEGMTYEDKYRQVGVWWGDFRFHLAMAVKSPSELNRFLGNSLSAETMYLLSKARKKGMPFFATPYYLSLLDVTGKAYDDEAIRSYILYSPQLVETYGNIRAWEKEDVVEAGKPNAAGWLLPDGHNIHRRYPEVAILIPDTMGRACGGLCASCQRMYDFQSERLNFEFESLRPKESWDHKLRRLMAYFEEDTQLRDILITGGDALMSQNKTLRNILEAVYRMACRKRKANQARPDGEKYAELQRVRLGARLPAYLPMRIDDQLVEVLKEFREKASAVGVKQFVIQTHFQSPLEVTPEAREAIRKILSAGWLITNQLVYTVAASRRGHTTRLRQVLNSLGVVCYYTFSVKGFGENYAVFTPNSRSMQEQQEEKLFGRMTEEQTAELDAALTGEGDTAGRIRRFMKKHRPAVPGHRPQCAQPAGHRQEHDLPAGGHHGRGEAYPALRPRPYAPPQPDHRPYGRDLHRGEQVGGRLSAPVGEDGRGRGGLRQHLGLHARSDRAAFRAVRLPRLPVRGDRPGEQSGAGIVAGGKSRARPDALRRAPIYLDISEILIIFV